MKSERRHELTHNALQQQLVNLLAFLKKNANYFAWGLLAAALIVIAIVWFVRRGEDERNRLQAAWDSVMESRSSPQADAKQLDSRISILADLAGQSKNKYVQRQATLALGDAYAEKLVTGEKPLDAAQETECTSKAAEYYSKVISQYGEYPDEVAAAHYGLARLAETRHDWKAAGEQYNEALKIAPEGSIVNVLAKQAIGELPQLQQPVKMAATAPAESQPASQAASTSVPTSASSQSQPATAAESAPADTGAASRP